MINYISKNITDERGVTSSVHIVNSIRVVNTPGSGLSHFASVQSWASLDSYSASGSPLKTALYAVDLTGSTVDGNILAAAALYLVGPNGGPFEAGIVSSSASPGETLELVKARKMSEIDTSRLRANLTTFPFSGKDIAVDPLSRSDIDGISDIVALTGELPLGFPLAWRATDGTSVPILDVPTWVSFVQAMVVQGLTNFERSESLKALVAASTTIEQVEAINWETPV